MESFLKPSEEKTIKELCDFISAKLDTDKGREIVSQTVKRLHIVVKNKLANEQSVKEMLVMYMATLPIFDALFGERTRLNPLTLVFNMAVTEMIELLEANKEMKLEGDNV